VEAEVKVSGEQHEYREERDHKKALEMARTGAEGCR
jgi:hypothetical protein